MPKLRDTEKRNINNLCSNKPYFVGLDSNYIVKGSNILLSDNINYKFSENRKMRMLKFE